MKWYWKDFLNGNFYEDYKQSQTSLNIEKFNVIWVMEEEIEKLSKYIKENIASKGFGLCHGSRNGFEVERFKKNLSNYSVLGTDISHTANKVKNLIQWDFHEVKNEWLNNVDFIYSNSFDHSYDPYKCLKAWLSCLSDKGLCFIHINPQSMIKSLEDSQNKTDCLNINPEEMLEIISSVNGQFIETIDLFKNKKNDRIAYIIKKEI